MYGYFVSYGYMGLVNGVWMLFATEAEYQRSTCLKTEKYPPLH